MTTCGEALVQLLEAYGVEVVFGIPGVHTVELYRGLPATGIRHVTPRHEQGAGFMADGYARVSGRPGVCFLITGPGVTNAATAMAQAFSDSVPMLVISAVNERAHLGMGAGRLHELPDQRQVTEGFTVFSHTLLDAAHLPEVIARAFAAFDAGRPGPVHVEIPIDVITAPVDFAIDRPARVARPGPDPEAVARAARALAAARRPLMVLGGGCVEAAAEARTVAERLAAPVFLTYAARGVLAEDHPLNLGATLAFEPARALLADADVVLAAGTEFSETDRDLRAAALEIGGTLVRVDIDPQQLARSPIADVAIAGDARLALAALAAALVAGDREPPALGELRARLRAQAVEARAGIVVVLWNNAGYGEIRDFMAGRGIAPVGVDLHTPDPVALARAYGWEAARADSPDDLERWLALAPGGHAPTLLEVRAP